MDALEGLLYLVCDALIVIDRLLNRTLVLGLGQLLGRDRSSLGVAGATLAAAGLFQPLRRRVQQAVDRRFDRRRYDAARTIARFSGRLRKEVDLDMLSGEMLGVIDQTMEPTTVWLWLRPAVMVERVTGIEPASQAWKA